MNKTRPPINELIEAMKTFTATTALAKHYKAPYTTVLGWIRHYRLDPMASTRPTREELMKLLERGGTAAVVDHYSISRQSACKWLRSAGINDGRKYNWLEKVSVKTAPSETLTDKFIYGGLGV